MKNYSKEEIQNKFNSLKSDIQPIYKNVCVIGQGFVGLPLALSFSMRNCNVIGLDIDEELIDNINLGITNHQEKYLGFTIEEILKVEIENENYIGMSSFKNALKVCNNIIFTVGMSVVNGVVSYEHIESACKELGKNIKEKDLIIIRSTLVPGTTEEFIVPLLENESGLKAGKDFYLAYASERIAEGKAFEEFENMPTVLAGINEESAIRAENLLKIICKAEIIISNSIKTVETAKVLENLQRDVNIAMVQEFARFSEMCDMDIFEVIRLANTHKRVDLLIPGAGVGGYCIPNAYYYLNAKAEKISLNLDLLKMSREKNEEVPAFIVRKLEELLLSVGKKLKKSKIAVLGISMKDYSNDDRISPAIKVIELLLEKGVEVNAFDPKVSTKYSYKVNNQVDAIQNSDVILVLAKQEGIIYEDLNQFAEIMKSQPIYMDIKAVVDKQKAEECGFKYWRI